MKKLFIIATMILVALQFNETKAQTVQPSDTLQIIAEQIAASNRKIVEINNSIRKHAIMAEASIPITLVGSIILVANPQRHYIDEDGKKMVNVRHDIGLITTFIGCGLFAGSFTPLIFKKAKIDERGIVIDLP